MTPLPRPYATAAGLALLALTTVGPLLLEARPVGFLPALPSLAADAIGKALVLVLMLLAVGARVVLDRRSEPRAHWYALGFAVLAAGLTACHWLQVDRWDYIAVWQRDLYLGVLNHHYDAPHVYRPLPYGFARLLEEITHDYVFSCLAYRWFYTYWFVWGWHRFARMFLTPARALLSLAPLPLLYPLSIAFYWGQLTDPLSHALFVLALIYIVEDRPVALAAALALGVVAKETALILVPVYLACQWRKGWRAWGWTAALAAAGAAAFVLVRVPLGWRPGYQAINGTEGLMVGTNLGIGPPLYIGAAPTYQNYLQPLLFVGVFLPAIAWKWRRIDGRLRAAFLVFAPLLLLSNLCFGWMYESRNYVPLLPLLAVMVLTQAPSAGKE